jgi:hypothetical protein
VTTIQILSLCVLVAAIAWAYIPGLLGGISLPTTQPPLMRHIDQIVTIRSTYRTPEVNAACNNLLSVLLQVKP